MKKKLLSIILMVALVLSVVGAIAACKTNGVEEAAEAYRHQHITDSYNKTSYELPATYDFEGTTYTITWTANIDNVKFAKSADGKTVTVTATRTAEVQSYKLIATFADDKGNTKAVEFSGTVPANPNAGGELGTTYNLVIRQLTIGSVIYAKAEAAATYYVGSTTTAAEGAEFFLEEVTGGTKIFTMVGTEKRYLGAKKSGTHNNIVLGGIVNDKNTSYEGSVWTIGDDGIKTVLDDGTTLYLGTYGDKTTFSVSDLKTYPAFLIEKGTEVKAQAEVGVSSQSENCTVTFTSHTADSNNKLVVDLNTVIKFTVTPADGYEVISVKNGVDVLEATEGVYSVTVTKGVSIQVETKAIGSNGLTSPVTGEIKNAIPTGWTYIPSNADYPNPNYYGNGGLKVNYTNMGILSPELDDATGDILVKVNIKALNKSNTPKSDNGDIFKVEGLDAEGNVVVTGHISTFTIDDNNTVTLNATGKVVKKIRVIMIEKPAIDGYAQNVNLGAVTIIWGEDVPAPSNNEAKIGTTEYATLAEAIAAVKGTDKVVIELLKDVTSGGIMFTSAQAVNVELNLGGHTLTIGRPLTGSAGTVSQSLHFEKGNTVVIKNGTITTEANSASMLLQNYCNLTLDGVTLDGSKLAGTGTAYTLSNNCGTVVIKGNSTIIARETNGVAFDLWYGMNANGLYDDGVSVTVEAGCTINGAIEYGAHSRVTGTDWIEKTVLVLPEGEYSIVYTCNLVTDSNANITIGGTKISDQQA